MSYFTVVLGFLFVFCCVQAVIDDPNGANICCIRPMVQYGYQIKSYTELRSTTGSRDCETDWYKVDGQYVRLCKDGNSMSSVKYEQVPYTRVERVAIGQLCSRYYARCCHGYVEYKGKCETSAWVLKQKLLAKHNEVVTLLNYTTADRSSGRTTPAGKTFSSPLRTTPPTTMPTTTCLSSPCTTGSTPSSAATTEDGLINWEDLIG